MNYHVFVILVVLLTFVFIEISEGVLFPQGYTQKLTLRGAGFDYTNPAYIGPGAYFRVTRKSRKGSPTLNALFPLLTDLSPNLITTYTAFQKVDNRWQETFLKGQVPLCTALDPKNKLYRVLYDYSNFPCQCPVLKGNYTITDFKFESKHPIPVVLGVADGLLRGSWVDGNTILLTYWFEMKVEH